MGIINMNGRIYDPLIARFMSADPKIPRPYNLQSFNRYSYAYNRPLKFVDMNGYDSRDTNTGSLIPNDPGAIAPTPESNGGPTGSGNGTGTYQPPAIPVNNPPRPPANTPVGPGSAATQNPNPPAAAPVSEPTPPQRQVEPINVARDDRILIACTGCRMEDLIRNAPPPSYDANNASVVLSTRSTSSNENEKTYVTYTLTDENGRVYFGRTSGYETPQEIVDNRFAYHHSRLEGFKNPQVDRVAYGDEGYLAIRGREQLLINSRNGIGSPDVGNKINGIFEFNPRRSIYLDAATRKWGIPNPGQK